ncbi:MAG: SMC-Scp complex subunit ScpB [Acetobacterales bacterium]
MDRAQMLRLVEASLFASATPVKEGDLAVMLPEGTNVTELVVELGELYRGRGVNLVQVAGGWAFRTAEDLAPLLRGYRKVTRKPSRAALETLAVIAYHQPVTRAEIEEIRGVALGKGTLDTLFECGWIKPRGRRRSPGRPVTWGTSDGFLDHFGLERLDDLPGLEELKAAGLLDKGVSLAAYRDRVNAEDSLSEEEGGSDSGDGEPLDPEG